MENKVDPLNRVIAHILAWGIYITVFFYCLGIILIFFNGKDYSDFNVSSFRSFESFFNSIFSLQPEPFLYLGTVTLIATPFVRVFYSIIMFKKMKDKKFLLISSLVGAILLVSILIGFFFSLRLG